jgi:phosphoglycolate phosphatase
MRHVSELVAFDLDGTLVDSRLDLAESANELLSELGAAPLSVDEVTGMIGHGAGVLVERAVTRAGLPMRADALDRFLRIYDRRLIEHTRPYAGVTEALEAIRPHAALALLTNKPEHQSRRLLAAFELEPFFQWVIGGDSPFPPKPDPAALRHLMRAASASPSRTVMIGDSMVDVETARRAGVHACVVSYGFGHYAGPMTLQQGEADVSQPADLPAAVAALLHLNSLKPSP